MTSNQLYNFEIPILLGPTATGKSSLAMKIAENHPVEIVSVDSRQIYKWMDIGTAKPSRQERDKVPHHMIDIIEPDMSYSAGRYARAAWSAIEEIVSRGKIPLVVGGSGLYLLALTGAMNLLPDRNEKLRKILSDKEEISPGTLNKWLSCLDPDSASTISQSDSVRSLRSLEIVLLTGYSASIQRTTSLKTYGNYAHPDFNFRPIGLLMDEKMLRERIEARVDKMLKDGLVDEVISLVERGFGAGSILTNSIGYAEILEHLVGVIDIETARLKIITNTWRFSKRQKNMFRRIKDITWTESCSAQKIGSLLIRNREGLKCLKIMNQ